MSPGGCSGSRTRLGSAANEAGRKHFRDAGTTRAHPRELWGRCFGVDSTHPHRTRPLAATRLDYYDPTMAACSGCSGRRRGYRYSPTRVCHSRTRIRVGVEASGARPLSIDRSAGALSPSTIPYLQDFSGVRAVPTVKQTLRYERRCRPNTARNYEATPEESTRPSPSKVARSPCACSHHRAAGMIMRNNHIQSIARLILLVSESIKPLGHGTARAHVGGALKVLPPSVSGPSNRDALARANLAARMISLVQSPETVWRAPTDTNPGAGTAWTRLHIGQLQLRSERTFVVGRSAGSTRKL